MIYLYLKTHNISGLKYLGKTTKDPNTYIGSGIVWRDHLKKYGSDNITTEILFMSDDKQEIKRKGIYYSKLWNIVESKSFANLRPEEGDGGDTSKCEAYKKGIKNRRRYYGENNPNFGSVYKLASPDQQIYFIKSKAELKKFCDKHNLSFTVFVMCMTERRATTKYGKNYLWQIYKVDNEGNDVWTDRF
jgi:hypothetical protein